MLYLITLLAGFGISGLWFVTTLWIRVKFIKNGLEKYIWSTPLLAAIIPIIMISVKIGQFPTNLNFFGNSKIWITALITVIITTTIKLFNSHKNIKIDNEELLEMCANSACMEIAQRMMMQLIIVYMIGRFEGEPFWGIPITAIIWCMGLVTQALVVREKIDKDLFIDVIASFVFSMGMGTVFYNSGCIFISMLGHAAERFLVTKADR